LALNPTPEDVNDDVLVQKTVPGFKLVITELVEEAKMDRPTSATSLASLIPQTPASDLLQVPMRQDKRRRVKNKDRVLEAVVPEERQVVIIIPELLEFPRVAEDNVVNVPDAPSTLFAEIAALSQETEAYRRRGRRMAASYSTKRSHSPPRSSIRVP
jgi:hypothetical protein